MNVGAIDYAATTNKLIGRSVAGETGKGSAVETVRVNVSAEKTKSSVGLVGRTAVGAGEGVAIDAVCIEIRANVASRAVEQVGQLTVQTRTRVATYAGRVVVRAEETKSKI